MTMPDERLRAVNNTREFLRSLLDPKKTPRVPRSVRMSAYRCLRHFPHEYEMESVAKASPEIFEKARK